MPNPSFDFENVNLYNELDAFTARILANGNLNKGNSTFFFKRRTGILTLAATIERLET